MTDFETWLHDYDERLYQYWVYKQMFVPYGAETGFREGYIKDVVELPDGDVLLGFQSPGVKVTRIEYYKLSEIALVYDEGRDRLWAEVEEDG